MMENHMEKNMKMKWTVGLYEVLYTVDTRNPA